MIRINLLKHQGLSFEAFKAWLNQLITDKKGALPDLNDWKLIKEKLDKVSVSKTVWVDYSNINLNRLYEENDSVDGEEATDDEEYTPWAGLDDVSGDDWVEIDDEMDLEYTTDLIEEINYLINLSSFNGCQEYADMPIVAAFYNGHPVDLGKLYDKRKESEDDANSICDGI